MRAVRNPTAAGATAIVAAVAATRPRPANAGAAATATAISSVPSKPSDGRTNAAVEAKRASCRGPKPPSRRGRRANGKSGKSAATGPSASSARSVPTVKSVRSVPIVKSARSVLTVRSALSVPIVKSSAQIALKVRSARAPVPRVHPNNKPKVAEGDDAGGVSVREMERGAVATTDTSVANSRVTTAGRMLSARRQIAQPRMLVRSRLFKSQLCSRVT